eukprot:CAMPEP_0117437456 /NCGR_PEP_ID=MMETSP0759-20121206/1532_1 /TAXON_ID=63605 /ORGANISM="Percolomonas cosmopolitus, Strain WS" /LENGTH=1076 /DNA_ID=CAMNT_0005229087 /DNA_START=2124 /DNA_END=5354 /DNA_ORIENTATION=+
MSPRTMPHSTNNHSSSSPNPTTTTNVNPSSPEIAQNSTLLSDVMSPKTEESPDAIDKPNIQSPTDLPISMNSIDPILHEEPHIEQLEASNSFEEKNGVLTGKHVEMDTQPHTATKTKRRDEAHDTNSTHQGTTSTSTPQILLHKPSQHILNPLSLLNSSQDTEPDNAIPDHILRTISQFQQQQQQSQSRSHSRSSSAMYANTSESLITEEDTDDLIEDDELSHSSTNTNSSAVNGGKKPRSSASSEPFLNITMVPVKTTLQSIRYPNGAHFEGSVEMEHMRRHGRGTLTYANGDTFDGDWCQGKRHGPAYCEFIADDRNLRALIGSFMDDVITNEDVDLTYTDGSRYFGKVSMQTKNDSLKELDGRRLEKFLRHGMGEMFFLNGESYSGTFHKDRMHGFGVFMGQEGQYYGNFHHGKKQGYGVLMFPNGTFYRGNWKNDKKNGKGDMIISNGSAISGTWKDNQVTKAQYVNLENDAIADWIPTVSLNLLRETMQGISEDKYSFAHSLNLSVADRQLVGPTKWIGFLDLNSDLFDQFAKKFRETTAYKFYLEQKKSSASQSGSGSSRGGSTGGGASSRGAPPRTDESNDLARSSLVTALEHFLTENCESGELGKIISAFDSMFHCRYRDITSKTAKRQKPLALDDFFSFLNLFHKHVSQVLTEEILSIYSSEHLLILLKNQVLSRLYKQLFEIYKFLYHQKDSHMRFKLKSLKSITMKEIGCPPDSIPDDDDYSDYQEAAQMLKKLSGQTCPKNKFKILKKTDDAIVSAYRQVKEKRRDRQFEERRKRGEHVDPSLEAPLILDLGANTKIPLHIYVFILANIAHACSELQFMSDFFDNEIATSVYALRFANYEQVVEFISKIDPSIRDENSEIIPVDRITERVSQKIDNIFSECSRKKMPQPKMLWLSSVFIAIAAVPLLERNHVLIFEQFFQLFDRYFEYAKIILQQASVNLERSSIDARAGGKRCRSGHRKNAKSNSAPSIHISSPTGEEVSPPTTPSQQERVEIDANAAASSPFNKTSMVTTSSLGFSEKSLKIIRKENQKIRYTYALIVERPFPSFVYGKFANRLEEAIQRFE